MVVGYEESRTTRMKDEPSGRREEDDAEQESVEREPPLIAGIN